MECKAIVAVSSYVDALMECNKIVLFASGEYLLKDIENSNCLDADVLCIHERGTPDQAGLYHWSGNVRLDKFEQHIYRPDPGKWRQLTESEWASVRKGENPLEN